MRACCRERLRRGPLNSVAERTAVCPACTKAFWIDTALVQLQDNKPIKAFESIKTVQRIMAAELRDED